MYIGTTMEEQEKPKPRRIKVPRGLDLLAHKKLKSHWDWYWKNHHKDHKPKIVIDFDEEDTE